MVYPQRSKLFTSVRKWKARAIARRQENVALKKRVAELTQSRDTWKEKAQTRDLIIADLQAENRRLTQPLPQKKNQSLPV